MLMSDCSSEYLYSRLQSPSARETSFIKNQTGSNVTVDLQWLKHNMFETGVVRANEC